jgi:hypothetical protein
MELFSLKGWESSAQGNALGTRAEQPGHEPRASLALKGRDPTASRPFRAKNVVLAAAVPRALPWAEGSQPFRLKNRKSLLTPLPPESMVRPFNYSLSSRDALRAGAAGSFRSLSAGAMP